MQINEFKSTLSTFADPGTEILFDRAKVMISFNGDIIEASISTRDGDVFVDEGVGHQAASTWILTRLARLPLLATRLRETIPASEYFVSPAAVLHSSLEQHPEDIAVETDDALNTTLNALRARSPLETSVLYITSDAGEGKTFLINQLAREQARRFTQRESDWLLVPIPLGGKHFLRFDDITIGALQNRYRFPFLYYESFLALVRMGVIIPAFDGFEEMFVENSSGEALSAMGILVGALDSRGALAIAARKAYYDFENLGTQEKLFGTISNYSVGFGKLELHRWTRGQFLAYCVKREVVDAERIYERVSERLKPTHSLLTRPVLVRRLVDIAIQSPSLDAFLDRIHTSGTDFFSVFVRGIVEREANEKWIDRSGDGNIGEPLLSADEHCELLSLVSLAMWEARVDFLKRDNLEFVTDYYCETKRKNVFQSKQIRERIRGHALLISSPNAAQSVEFDHEEFRLFFLGEGVADQLRPLNDRAKGDVLATLRKGVLPRHAQHSFTRAIKRDPKLERLEAARFLLEIASLDGQASYTQENCSGLIVRLLREVDGKGLEITGLAFGPDSLRDRKLTNLCFKKCYFAPTSLDASQFASCSFITCKFTQLRLYSSTKFAQVKFDDCSVDMLRLMERELDIRDNNAVRKHLEQRGVVFAQAQALTIPLQYDSQEVDPELRDVGKLIRYFLRSTHMGENVIKIKLGNRAHSFLNETLPDLIANNVLMEIENRGCGTQRRFKMKMSLERIDTAISNAQGSYSRFLRLCNTQ